MSRSAWTAAVVCLAAAGASRAEPVAFTATLAGHAILPAQTFALPPPDAPFGLFKSGRFAGNERSEALYSRIDRRSGLGRPFPGQPVQGFSGLRHLGDGRFLVVGDNGFGSRGNSADAMLMLHILVPDWASGRVTIERTLFLNDPDRVVPYPITSEHSAERYLTGADLDPESIQVVTDGYWIGDEFGPYLIRVDATGRITDFTSTEAGGLQIRSPDHHRVVTPDDPSTPTVAFNLGRSRGFEGMALATDGVTLLPLLEGQLFDSDAGVFETQGGRPVLRLLEFDTTGGGWSSRIRYYPLEEEGNAIGDFNMIDDRRGLVIERDWNEGDGRLARVEAAAFKRVYLVDIEDTDDDGVVRKIGYVDLLAVADPDGVARTGSIDGVFAFPFVTIEGVDLVDDRHVVVVNDNNYPGSTGRAAGVADDNELILLEVGALLAAE